MMIGAKKWIQQSTAVPKKIPENWLFNHDDGDDVGFRFKQQPTDVRVWKYNATK
jgi:uncharacterized protein YcbX